MNIFSNNFFFDKLNFRELFYDIQKIAVIDFSLNKQFLYQSNKHTLLFSPFSKFNACEKKKNTTYSKLKRDLYKVASI